MAINNSIADIELWIHPYHHYRYLQFATMIDVHNSIKDSHNCIIMIMGKHGWSCYSFIRKLWLPIIQLWISTLKSWVPMVTHEQLWISMIESWMTILIIEILFIFSFSHISINNSTGPGLKKTKQKKKHHLIQRKCEIFWFGPNSYKYILWNGPRVSLAFLRNFDVFWRMIPFQLD